MLEMVEGYRLSPQQRRLWTRQQETSAGGAAQCVLGISGAVDPSRLHAAVRGLVERHEALRTHLRRSPGMKLPLQVVGEAVEPAWREIDLRPSGPAAGEGSWEALRAEEASTPFDLERGALLRAVLARLGDESYRLLLTAPALAIDATSLRNLFEDLCQIHGGEALEEEPVQHLQFSEWHNDLLAGEEAEAGRRYWREWLSRFQDAGRLPLESADSVIGLLPSGRWTFSFPPDVARRISALAQRYGGSAAGFLLAAWHTLLARLAGYGEMGTSFLGPDRKYREARGGGGPPRRRGALGLAPTRRPAVSLPLEAAGGRDRGSLAVAGELSAGRRGRRAVDRLRAGRATRRPEGRGSGLHAAGRRRSGGALPAPALLPAR